MVVLWQPVYPLKRPVFTNEKKKTTILKTNVLRTYEKPLINNRILTTHPIFNSPTTFLRNKITYL